jgi:hypothetical protein
MREWRLREMLIIFTASSSLIFASYAEVPYLSRLLTIPARFTDYFLIYHVLSDVLHPILHYFNFDGTDEHNLSQFMTGITGLIVFPSATWVLHNWTRICVFLYALVFNVKSAAFLVSVFGIVALWKKMDANDWKAQGKAYVWKTVLSTFRYLAATVTTNFSKFLTLHRISWGSSTGATLG